jgi:hypothetical protein
LKKLLYHFQEAAGNVTLDSESFTIKSNNSNKEVKPDTNNSDSGSKGSCNGGDVSIPWSQIQKHQVSPASHPKCLLKLTTRVLDKGFGGHHYGTFFYSSTKLLRL